MTAAYPGGSNTHISTFVQNSLIVSFTRNVTDFALNRYAQIVPTDYQNGKYLKLDTANASRVISATGDEFAWADGDMAPLGEDSKSNFQFSNYMTKRQGYPFRLGGLSVQQADWDVVAQHAADHAQKAMTVRTMKAVNLLADSAQYDAAHVKTATQAGGGKWDVATADNNYIQKSLSYAARIINKATQGRVTKKDLVLVVSPDLAEPMLQSNEIRDYLKQSPFAQQYLQGEGNPTWGAAKLYGIELVVEDAVRTSSKKGATDVSDYVLGSTYAALISRVGGLESVGGRPSFSSLTIFEKENMTVEARDDSWNRLLDGRVTDDVDVVVTAPASGFLFTACSG